MTIRWRFGALHEFSKDLLNLLRIFGSLILFVVLAFPKT